MEQKKPNRTGGSKSGGQKPAGKSSKKTQSTSEYVFGWLGRQVGHVKKAVQSDVGKPAQKPAGKPASKPKAKSKPKSAPKPQPQQAPSEQTSLSEKVIFRQDKVEEAEMPHQPGVILRRTIIDEVVVERETTIEPTSPKAKDAK